MNTIKIFYIVEASIEHDIGGGGDGMRKVYHALKSYCFKNNSELGIISLNDKLPESLLFSPKKSRKFDILVRFARHSNYLFFFWQKYKHTILDLNPDVVVLGRSRYGFMAKDIKRILPACKVITVFENVEIDYVEPYFVSKKGLSKSLHVTLESAVVKRDESDCVKYSDGHVFLSERDQKRIAEIYGFYSKISEIIPVCLRATTELSEKPSFAVDFGTPKSTRKVVFSGRLWYNSNIESVEWLLKNIISKFENRDDVEFIIAGSRPNSALKDRINRHKNVILYENFVKSTDIIPRYSLVISPTFTGAGMKVKVADALSMGLMVVASDEALVGYEEVSDLRGLIKANNVDEYTKAIEEYLMMDDAALSEIEKENKAAFEKYYSYERAKEGYARLLKILK